MSWIEIVSLVVGIVLGVTTLVTVIIGAYTKKFKSSVKETVEPMIEEYSKATQRQIHDMRESLNKEMIDLRIKLDEYRETSDAADIKMMKSLMDLSRDRINQAHKYYISIGNIDDHTMCCLQALGESYEGLGGNSFAHDEIAELKEMYRANKKTKRKDTADEVGVGCEKAK